MATAVVPASPTEGWSHADATAKNGFGVSRPSLNITSRSVTPPQSEVEVTLSGLRAARHLDDSDKRHTNKKHSGVQKFFLKVDQRVHTSGDILAHLQDRPDKEWRLRLLRLTQSKVFALSIALVIFVNAVLIGMETDDEISSAPRLKESSWYVVAFIFALIFSVEIMLRLVAEQCYFFRDGWNIFDFSTVLLTCLDTFVITPLATESKDFDVFSVLRVLRLLRVVRIVRLLKYFKELWLLVVGVADAVRTLLWANMLILLVIFMYAVFFRKVIGSMQEAVQDPEMMEYFGSVPRSIFTFFQVMTLDAWGQIAWEAGDYFTLSRTLFITFLMMTTYSIMNVVVAVIVDATLDQAVHQQEEIRKEQEKAAAVAAQRIQEVFRAADADGDGEVTKVEFLQAIEIEDTLQYLHDVGIDTRQAENLFDILDYDESGALSATEFTEGMMRARGQAKAREVLTLQCGLWQSEQKARREISALYEKVEVAMDELDRRIGNAIGDLEAAASATLGGT